MAIQGDWSASYVPNTLEQIVRLNQAGKMSAKRWVGRVGGMDQYSRWHLPELVGVVGVTGVPLIEAAFPGQEAEAIKVRETALC